MSKRRRAFIPNHVRTGVAARDGGSCVFCGQRVDLHLDHVVPHSLGGGDGSDNLRLLCRFHNLRRGVKPTPDDGATRPPVALGCIDCTPGARGDLWGWCRTCGTYADVPESLVDACPDPESCGCEYVLRIVKRSARRTRRRQRRARAL